MLLQYKCIPVSLFPSKEDIFLYIYLLIRKSYLCTFSIRGVEWVGGITFYLIFVQVYNLLDIFYREKNFWSIWIIWLWNTFSYKPVILQMVIALVLLFLKERLEKNMVYKILRLLISFFQTKATNIQSPSYVMGLEKSVHYKSV